MHEVMIPQGIMQSSIAHANGQLDLQYSIVIIRPLQSTAIWWQLIGTEWAVANCEQSMKTFLSWS